MKKRNSLALFLAGVLLAAALLFWPAQKEPRGAGANESTTAEPQSQNVRPQQTLLERRKAQPAEHYLDRLDYKDVPEFLQKQKNPAPGKSMSREQSSNRNGNLSTADEREAKAGSGNQISLTEYAAALKAEKNPSIRAQPKAVWR